MKIACIIPARLGSTRFPRKILEPLKGKPLIQWVWEAASRVSLFDTVVCAIDAKETEEVIASFGGKSFMTQVGCKSGTDRLIELQQRGLVDADIYVNWQGDEPFIDQQMIQDLLQSCKKEPSDVWTLMKKMEASQDISSPHLVKVVCDKKGYALYFSRSPIPYYRDGGNKGYFKHVGLYAYTKNALQAIAKMPTCPLEEAEQLEQLRFLYNGLRIRVHETLKESLGIDLPEHLEQAKNRKEI